MLVERLRVYAEPATDSDQDCCNPLLYLAWYAPAGERDRVRAYRPIDKDTRIPASAASRLAVPSLSESNDTLLSVALLRSRRWRDTSTADDSQSGAKVS